MPTFRRASHVGQSIESLLTGDFSDFELLVRDDGDGTDGTAEAVEQASRGDTRVQYHRNARRLAMPGNLNAGIADSRGSFIAVCHDHDLYAPNFLSSMVAALACHPSALFAHCGISIISLAGESLDSHVGQWPDLSRGPDWLRFMLGSLHCPVCALTLVRREAHQRYGLYDPSFGFIADVEMWMRLSSHGDVAYVPGPLVGVRVRESNHWANSSGALIATLRDIHRCYLPRAFSGRQLWAKRATLEARVLLALAKLQAVHLRNALGGRYPKRGFPPGRAESQGT
jgi:glycosyltransferase involved in cell wall biosynthesis